MRLFKTPQKEKGFSSKSSFCPNYPRDELVSRLLEYNQKIGNDQKALENIYKLKDDSQYCVVAGQQTGFMGGPLYTIYKAIHALHIAEKEGLVPIFWAATEDHDSQEVDFTYRLDGHGNLEKWSAHLSHQELFVEDIPLTEQIKNQALDFLSFSSFEKRDALSDLIKRLPLNISYGEFGVRILAYLFKNTGLVFLEPYLIRTMAKQLFIQAVKKKHEIQSLLHDSRFKGLETLLFYKTETNRRKKLEGEEKELIALIEESTERISANAALRPIIQNNILPVKKIIAGPGELAYHKELIELHKLFETPIPEVIQRVSITLLTKQGKSFLERLNIGYTDVSDRLDIPKNWEEFFPKVHNQYNQFVKECQNLAQDRLKHALASRYLAPLKKSLIQREVKQLALPSYALHYLNQLIQPKNNKQERVLNFFFFSFKSSFIQEMIHQMESGYDYRIELD